MAKDNENVNFNNKDSSKNSTGSSNNAVTGSRNRNHRITMIQKIVAVLLALTIWQVLAMSLKLPILLVSPLAVIKRLGTIWMEADFWHSTLFTLAHIMVGFFIALVLGILLACLSDRFKIVESLLWPYMVTIKSVPVASIVVICLIWLSSANLSVFISFLIVLPIVYQNMLKGLKQSDRELEEAAMVNGASTWQRFRYAKLPIIRPYLETACSITIGMAWKAGVAAEIIGTPKGSIGQMLYLSKIYLDTDDLLAWTLVLVILSVICEKIILILLKLLLNKLTGVSKEK